jgi:hypothetical protein
LLQLSRLPEGRLTAILNDDQWGKLHPQMTAAKGMEATLKQGGYVPAKGVVVAPPAANKPVVKPDKKRG